MSNESDEEFFKLWMSSFQESMEKARQRTCSFEYEMQQNLYRDFASKYDKAISLESYSGPSKIAEKINDLVFDKNIKILDYGCGTGLVSEYLIKFGFSEIDGVDANQEMLNSAKAKGTMNKLILGRNEEGLKNISSNEYDIVCSAGTFFLSATHPGTECFREICRIIKSGGYFILLTKQSYISCSYVNWSIVEELEKEHVLEIVSKEPYEGYRKHFPNEQDTQSTGIIFTFRVL
ncbi:putative methyltransferase GWCH70_2453 [Hydra vulgaris]|uniref:putative methyltransferase GWCH70_2453 n=1 Tax=Hydra vulgaris TaxID=6087 RepID=UPI001F5EC057|nr:putative methyltransferase GWCH70_2453 [Hydra vulgaris]